MNRVRGFAVLALGLTLCTTPIWADVKTEEKSFIKVEGMLGRMVGMFGGKAAREGVVNTVAVNGNRKATFNDYSGEIIDLSEEKVYTLDTKKKTYTVKTFAQMRQEMEDARRKAEEEARKAPREAGEPKPKEGAPEKEYEIDFNVKETGQTKTLNGYNTREVVMTVTVREKGKTLEQSGGIVMTADSWLAPRIAAMKEVQNFDQRYAAKLAGPLMPSAEQMAAALAMYPGLKQALSRFQAENVNMDGTAIQTIVTFEGVKNPEQMKQESSSDSGGGVIGGVLGKLRKKKDEAPKNRATIMTMNHELLKVSMDVTAGDVAIPAGYQAK